MNTERKIKLPASLVRISAHLSTLALGCAALTATPRPQSCEGTWQAFAPGSFDGRVHALAWHGGQLYAAGEFTRAGGQPANHLAVYDGTGWSEVGGGLNGDGFALLSFGGELWVGGRFDRAGTARVGNLAVWSGRSFRTAGGGCDAEVRALHAHGGAVLVGGSFRQAGAVAADGLARYAAGAWSRFGPQGVSTVSACATISVGLGSELWIGASGPTGGAVHAHDGAGWRSIGAGLPPVTGLAETPLGILAASPYDERIYRWSGSSWTTVGTVPIGSHAIAVYGGTTYIGSHHGLFRMGPTGAHAVGNVNGDVRAFASDGLGFFLGGMFTSVDGAETTCVSRRRAGRFQPLANADAGRAAYRNVDAACTADLDGRPGDEFYIAGLFHHVGAVRAPHIARWDGNAWSALGEGLRLGSFPSAMLAFDGKLYVAGQIDGTPSVSSPNIAAWDGSRWSAVGGGLPRPAGSLAIHDDGSGPALYAGGHFGIAKLEASGWRVLGTITGGTVKALASYRGQLYAGGSFTDLNGTAFAHLARWDGAAWSSVGGGVRMTALGVDELEPHAGSLWVGGAFDRAGSLPVRNLAVWTDSQPLLPGSWSDAHGGVDSWVLSMQSYDGALYLGGILHRAGNIAVRGVTVLRNGRFESTGPDEPTGAVHVVTVFDADGSGPREPELMCGGLFDTAAGSPSQNVASLRLLGAPWTNLGGANSGSLALSVRLAGTGALTAGASTTLTLDHAAPNTRGSLVVAFQSTPVDLFGGRWFATPAAITVPFAVDGAGAWTISFGWPAFACGAPVWFQTAQLDPRVSRGFTFSNGLRAISR